MLIGVFSDVHDHLRHLDRALELFAERGAAILLFCGDFCSPIPSRTMGAYDGSVHCVFGNGDGDRYRIQAAARSSPTSALELHGEHAELTLGQRNVALTHFPLYGRALARTGDYDAVFSGHTHELHEERFSNFAEAADVQECLWVNPGEVLGWKGPATVFLWDTEENAGEFVTL